MPNTLDDKDWWLLLTRIRSGKCTPFLGAGASHDVLPLGSEVAKDWAHEFSFPLKEFSGDLIKVAQFLVVKFDNVFPKEELARRFQSVSPPDFSEPDEPHGVLADLSLPIYITTNYDSFMAQALQSRGRSPNSVLCQWNASDDLSDLSSEPDLAATPETPVVFHLHGCLEDANSMVLTQDDYLDFLVEMSRNQDLLPERIQEAFADTSLLFLGYSLNDWSFLVLFRSIVGYLQKNNSRTHVSVQLLPIGQVSEEHKVREYLDRYFDIEHIKVYWGTCREFASDLRKRWEEFSNGR